MRRRFGKTALWVACLFILAFPQVVFAIPALQIYIPGAEYDPDTETWVIHSYSYQLWVAGAEQDIYDVKIALAVPEGESDKGSIDVTWLDTLSGGFDASLVPPGGEVNLLPQGQSDYGQPDYPEQASLNLSAPNAMSIDAYRASYGFPGDGINPDPATYGFEEDATPLMGDGSQVPPHDVFPTDYYEYFIGDFGSDVQDVYNYTPEEGESEEAGRGQIKAFQVDVHGYTWVDIVAYDHVINGSGKARYVFSPFSHDGGGGSAVPEPATLLLFGTGLLGLGAIGRKRLRGKRFQR